MLNNVKTVLNAEELLRRVVDESQQKADYVVKTEGMQMYANSYHGNDNLTLDLNQNDQNSKVYSINNHALGQMATTFQVPRPYVDRMLLSSASLVADNFNHWFKNSDSAKMIRTHELEHGAKFLVRAFLSDKYRRVDNDEIAKTVLPILLDPKNNWEITECQITDTKLYIKAIATNLIGEVKKGDAVRYGVIISNSEVGSGAINVKPFIDRCVCDNGLIIADNSMRATHLTSSQADGNLWSMLSDQTKSDDNRLLLKKVEDVVEHTANRENFEFQLDRLKEADGIVINKPQEAVKVLKQTFNFTELEHDSILNNLMNRTDELAGPVTKWTLSNAVTHLAHDTADYDKGIDYEVIGNRILDLPNQSLVAVA
tara:strand:- start:85 stop:1194 length:1110 start_codon:yes stop_codon:yes gene_type:complete